RRKIQDHIRGATTLKLDRIVEIRAARGTNYESVAPRWQIILAAIAMCAFDLNRPKLTRFYEVSLNCDLAFDGLSGDMEMSWFSESRRERSVSVDARDAGCELCDEVRPIPLFCEHQSSIESFGPQLARIISVRVQ